MNTWHNTASTRVLTDATIEPISLEEAKAQCNVLHDDNDKQFLAWIKTARRQVERITNRTCLLTTLTKTLDCFPCWAIQLRKPPVIAITSVVYVALDGTAMTMSASDYQLDAKAEPGRLLPAYNTSWPSTRDQAAAVTVTYTAGYGGANGTAADVPEELRQAMLMLISHYYENRSAVLVGTISKYMEFAIESLTDNYRLVEYA